jgi:hypothetical protein
MTTRKGYGRKRSWPNFKVLSRHSPRGTKENHEKFNQDSRSPEPRIEPGTSRIRSKRDRLRNLYTTGSSNQGGVCSGILGNKKYTKFSVGKDEGKSDLGDTKIECMKVDYETIQYLFRLICYKM